MVFYQTPAAASGTLEAAGPAALAASGGVDHWAVRYNAAQLVAQVCVRFGDPYYNVQVRGQYLGCP
jgi:hypothetical protein